MAAYRYGRIYHSNDHHISLRFASAKERDDFRGEFDAYHADHDHDGEVPRFVDITAQDANRGYQSGGRNHGTIHPVKLVVLSNGEFNYDYNERAEYVTIDGYTLNEIKDYHNPSGLLEYSWYTPPTSCVPPIIVVENKFVDSSILKRHELSAFFRDMSDEEYQALLASVEKNGFIDNVIRVYEGQILDGWHRYRAGRDLNLLRKLKFQEWNEDEHRDGDPRVFAYAKNMERRHQDKSVRAQITVAFHKRFLHGGDRKSESSHQNGDLKSQDEPKTREQLAKEAGVGTSTIDRAIAIEKKGESEAVIRGEKTAGEVLEPPAVKVEKKNRAQAEAAETQMWEAFKKAGLNEYMDEDDLANEVTKVYGFPDLTSLEESDYLPWIARFKTVTNALEKKAGWVRNLIADFEEIKVDERCQDAEEKMWAALDAVAPDWNRDDFAAAACDKHPNWGVEAFPVIPDIPAIWEGRFDLLKREIELPADWIRAMLDKMAEPRQQSDEEPEVAEASPESHTEILKRLPDDIKAYLPTWINDNPGTEGADLKLLLGVRFEMKHGVQRGQGAFFREEMEALLSLMKSNDPKLAAMVRERLGTATITAEDAAEMETNYPTADFLKDDAETDVPDTDPATEDRMERCRTDLTEVYQQAYTWEGLEIHLYAEEYGIDVDVIEAMQKEIAAEHPKPEPQTDSSVEADAAKGISAVPISDLFAEIKKRIVKETDYNPRVVNEKHHDMKFNSLACLRQIDDPAAKLWIIADLGKHFCDENPN